MRLRSSLQSERSGVKAQSVGGGGGILSLCWCHRCHCVGGSAAALPAIVTALKHRDLWIRASRGFGFCTMRPRAMVAAGCAGK